MGNGSRQGRGGDKCGQHRKFHGYDCAITSIQVPVHKWYNRSIVERVSMPFLFGEPRIFVLCFDILTSNESSGRNFNFVEDLVSSCQCETNPAKCEPISCGGCRCIVKQMKHGINYIKKKAGCQLRFKLANDVMKGNRVCRLKHLVS